MEIQQKIQFAENNSDEQEYTEADLSMEEHLERKKREVMYQRVFEERDFKEIGELNQMTKDQCKWMYYGAIRKIRRKMGEKSKGI